MKVISVKKLVKKRFKSTELSDEWKLYLGDLPVVFDMLIWGIPFAGKSSFVNALLKELTRLYTVLYVVLEEGFSKTSKAKAISNGLAEISNLKYANHETTFFSLMEFLKKPRSPKVVVIDSLQYLDITYIQYKKLKEAFPNKSFIYISHADGKLPDGKTAKKIRHDVNIKIFVHQFIAFIESRYGGGGNYVIWEDEAKRKWGRKLFNHHTKNKNAHKL